ncbi:MAG: hypothetical protein WD872_15355 [Pirellulaceae bacterium]
MLILPAWIAVVVVASPFILALLLYQAITRIWRGNLETMPYRLRTLLIVLAVLAALLGCRPDPEIEQLQRGAEDVGRV